MQVAAMELKTLTPELPQLLMEIGVNYDPDRLAAVLSSRQLEINARAVQVAAVLGGFIVRLLQVRIETMPDIFKSESPLFCM
jgi:hypothetical protein